MKLSLSILAVFAALILAPNPAFADACSERARIEAANRPNVTLLAVRSKVNANGRLVCIVTVRVVPLNGQPPRVVTRRFRP